MSEYDEMLLDDCRADAEWEALQEATARKKRLDGELDEEAPETRWYCPNCGEAEGSPIQEPGTITDPATGYPMDEFDGCTLCVSKKPELPAFQLDNSPLPSWAEEAAIEVVRGSAERSSPPTQPRGAEPARLILISEVA